MEEYGKRPPPNKGEEFIIANSGRQAVTDVEIGGKRIHLRSAGATVYDRALAMEIKDKYRNNPNLMVIEKPYRSLNDGHKHIFTVPELPWHRKRIRERNNGQTDATSQETSAENEFCHPIAPNQGESCG